MAAPPLSELLPEEWLSASEEASASSRTRRRTEEKGLAGGQREFSDWEGLAFVDWKKKDSPWKETERLRVVVVRYLEEERERERE